MNTISVSNILNTILIIRSSLLLWSNNKEDAIVLIMSTANNCRHIPLLWSWSALVRTHNFAFLYCSFELLHSLSSPFNSTVKISSFFFIATFVSFCTISLIATHSPTPVRLAHFSLHLLYQHDSWPPIWQCWGFITSKKMVAPASIFSHSFSFKLGIISASALSSWRPYPFLLSAFSFLCHSWFSFTRSPISGTRILHRLMKAP